MKWLILFLGIIANASASILIKVSMSPPRKLPSIHNPLTLFTNSPFITGLALYGIALLLYTAALARLPLNVAHPILTAGAISVVALSSVIIFHEPLPWTTGAGILCILLGVALITAHSA